MARSRTAAILAIITGLWLPSGVVLGQFGDWPAVYDPLELLTLNLDMDPDDWATVQNDDPYDEVPQIEVPAWFWADGEDPILISVRRKPGDPLTEAPGFIKVSLKLDINEYVIGQSWHGLKKLSLENGDDQDVVSEGLAWQIERLASGTQGYGYQAGHFAWVRLVINGVDTGVYVNVEQRDKRFLENRDLYTEGETWLYKKGDLGPATLEVGGPQDSPATEALCFLPFNTENPCTPDPDLVTATEQWVNVKGLLTLMANDAFQGNGDALLTKGKNFYYADFLTAPKRMYLPWDRDSSLSSQAVNQDIYTGDSDYAALLDEAEFRAQYNQIFNDLVCGPWSTESLTSFLNAVEPVLTDALAADLNNQFGGDVAGHFDGLRTLITDRVTNVIGQIEGFEQCPTIQVNLNEFMASNAAFIEDPDEPGEYPDWFELHNPSASEVDLGGIYVTDDSTFPTKWQIAAGVTIPGNGHLLFWADEDPEQGPLHANLKLSAGGEELYVFDTNGVTVIDSIVFGAQVTDVSYGRYPDGSGGWGFMATPTPGAANSIHNAPPAIDGTTRTPELPTDADPVWITSTVTDDFVVVNVTLSYDSGAGWIDVTMFDDGAHSDGAAGDDVYGGQIPAFGSGTVVDYYITAIDDLGAERIDPINAPLLPYSYYVGYEPLPLFINEFMADNDNFIEDPDQPLAYEDWVELYNAGPSSIDLEGMYLTDDLQNPLKYQIPAGVSIAAGGYLVFWTDDDIEQGPLHTNFKLSAVGEEIGLFDTDAYGNMPIDTVTFGQQFTDTSQGRCPDATDNWQLFSLATPGASNGPCGTEQQACCLPGLICDDLDLLACVSAGGIAQGAGTECATVTCPECIVDTDCNDGVSCTADACNEAANVCNYTPFDALCDNGLFCDGAETCDPVTGCQPGTDPCPGQGCDEENDQCVGGECQNDSDCNDGSWCTGVERCVDSVCVPGDDPCPGQICIEAEERCVDCLIDAECDDNADCTINTCVDEACVVEDTCPDDGLFCTGVEFCNVQTGACDQTGDPCPGFCDEDTDTCPCAAPIVEAVGPRYIAITPQPTGNPVPVSFLVTSPDWPCLSKYVGGFSECGNTGSRCQSDADCNECGSIAGACLTDDDCRLCTDNQTRCHTNDDCPSGFACSIQYSCLLSGNTCELQPLGPIDVDADGLDDGVVATLVDNPASAASMTPEEWGTSLKRCSLSFEACTIDAGCTIGTCSATGGVCDVAAQDCPMVCAAAQTECEGDVHCPPGDACTGVQTCEDYETCDPGRLYVTGADLLPSELAFVDGDWVVLPTDYEIWADCGGLHGPVEVTMPVWCDADRNNIVSFDDIQAGIMAFEGRWPSSIPARTVATVDIVGNLPCAPEQVVSFDDISFTIFAFQGEHYSPDILSRFDECGVPCP